MFVSHVILSQAFEAIRTLLEAKKEIAEELSRAFGFLALAMETFPNSSMPLDEEFPKATGMLNYFTTENKDLSAGIRTQVGIVCEQLMAYDENSWEKVGAQFAHLETEKEALSSAVSKMVDTRHDIKKVTVDAGPRTYRVEIAKRKLVDEIDRSIPVLQSSIDDYTEALEIFQFAKEAYYKKQAKQR